MKERRMKERVNSEYIAKGIMSGFGLLIVALLGWMGMNVSHIPIIEHDFADMRSNIQSNIEDNKLKLADHETRLRLVEQNLDAHISPSR